MITSIGNNYLPIRAVGSYSTVTSDIYVVCGNHKISLMMAKAPKLVYTHTHNTTHTTIYLVSFWLVDCW